MIVSNNSAIDWDSVGLGKYPDNVLAKRLQVGRSSVTYQRHKRNIPPFAHATDRRPKGIDWANQPLGKMPDTVLAAKLGLTSSAVRAARIHRGIPVYCANDTAPPVDQYRKQANALAKAEEKQESVQVSKLPMLFLNPDQSEVYVVLPADFSLLKPGAMLIGTEVTQREYDFYLMGVTHRK